MSTRLKIIFISILILSVGIASYTQIDWKKELSTPTSDAFPGHTSLVVDMKMDSSGKLKTITVLTPEQLQLQETAGCVAGECHKSM